MKEFEVQIPIAGVVRIGIEAENEQDAIKKAMDGFDMRLKGTGLSGYELLDWNIYESLSDPVLRHSPLDRVQAEEI